MRNAPEILIIGEIGSGKTTLAQLISQALEHLEVKARIVDEAETGAARHDETLAERTGLLRALADSRPIVIRTAHAKKQFKA